MSDERTEMLTAAIAATVKAGRAVNVKNIKTALPENFFWDFDNDAPLDSNVVFAEIQAAHAAMPKAAPMIATAPTGAALPDMPPVDDSEFLGEDSLPETAAMPVSEATPTVTDHDVTDGGNVRPLSLQVRLATARERERELIGELHVLKAKEADARAALAKAILAFQEADPTRETPEQLRRNFIAQSNAERAARAAGESWATRPGRERRGNPAYVDAERMYSNAGGADGFARRLLTTGNRRGAYDKRYVGMVNRDPSRGPVPAPVFERPTIPALADK